MPSEITIDVECRIPTRTKARMFAARLLAHLGIVWLPNTLAYQYRFGQSRWQTAYLPIDRELLDA